MQVYFIYLTCQNISEAKKISYQLVKKNLQPVQIFYLLFIQHIFEKIKSIQTKNAL